MGAHDGDGGDRGNGAVRKHFGGRHGPVAQSVSRLLLLALACSSALLGLASPADAGTVSGVSGPGPGSTTAAGATQVQYQGLGFTVSATGTLVANGGKVTITGPA